MRAILAILFLLSSVAVLARKDDILDLCKTNECMSSTTVTNELPVNLTTSTSHTVIDDTSVYYTNFTLSTWSADDESDNAVNYFVAYYGFDEDFCITKDCWLRARWNSTYDIDVFHIAGAYSYENSVLTLYGHFDYIYPEHNPVTYTVSLETCVLDEDSPNHCLMDMDKSHKGRNSVIQIKKKIPRPPTHHNYPFGFQKGVVSN